MEQKDIFKNEKKHENIEKIKEIKENKVKQKTIKNTNNKLLIIMIIILVIGMFPKPNPQIVIVHKTYGGIFGGSSTFFYDENGNIYEDIYYQSGIPKDNDYYRLENSKRTSWIPPIIVRSLQLQSLLITNYNYATKESGWESITDGQGEYIFFYNPFFGYKFTLKEMDDSNADTTYICSINGNIISFIVSTFL